MLTLNGHIFVKDHHSPDTPPNIAGTYQIRADGVMLFDKAGNPRVFLVNNRHRERFAVSCSRTTGLQGGIRYMYGLSTLDSQWLGLDDLTFRQASDEVWRVLDELGLGFPPNVALI